MTYDFTVTENISVRTHIRNPPTTDVSLFVAVGGYRGPITVVSTFAYGPGDVLAIVFDPVNVDEDGVWGVPCHITFDSSTIEYSENYGYDLAFTIDDPVMGLVTTGGSIDYLNYGS